MIATAGPDAKPTFTGAARTFRVWLDTNQYQQDMANVIKGGEVRGLRGGKGRRGEERGKGDGYFIYFLRMCMSHSTS